MFWGVIFILAGSLMLLQGFGILPENVELFWPILLIALGVSIIFKRKNCCEFWVKEEK